MDSGVNTGADGDTVAIGDSAVDGSAASTDSAAILSGLDEAQRLAATTLDGPVRIVAGAGAGKTRTVTRRIAHACASGAWDPARTLAVTFSVKAAAEMRSRLSALGVRGVTAATFHSAALHQLRRVWMDVSDAPFPRLAEDTRDIVAQGLREATGSADADELTVRMVRDEINWCKVSLIASADYPRVVAATGRTIPGGLDADGFAAVYAAYERNKSARGLIDFDDILLVMCHVLESFPDVAAEVRRSVGWLTVDEYQDVSPLQHRLMTLWLGGNRNVCVVGDPAQTIYSFAGASSYDLLGFADEFGPLAADVDLATDYRSTPQVVDYANRVLAASPVRQDYLRLRSGRDDGTRVTRTVYATDREEAAGVASRIARGVRQGKSPSDFAVLVRINAQSAAVCAELARVGLRCRVRRDSGWAAGAVADIANMDREQAVSAGESRGEGSGGESGAGVAGSAVAGVAGGASAGVTVPAASAANTAPAGFVTVSTIHAAKGLEFRHVFVIGCSEGLLPYGSPSDADLLEEERRLLYVAVTRAEDSLHLSYARTKDGGSHQRAVSRLVV